MTKIAIVTDSGSDIQPDVAEKYNIKVVPLQVVYKDRVLRDGIDADSEYILQHLEEEIPKTSLPLSSDVVSVFEELQRGEYTHILMIHISSALSGTYQMIRNFAEDYKQYFKIEVIDSKFLSMALGHSVIEAAKEVMRSNDFQKAIDRVSYVLKNTAGFFTVDTLKYLKKGGRISKFEGTLASMLDIRPVIGIAEDGSYYPAAKVRGRKRSLNAMFDLVMEKIKDKKAVVASAVHTMSVDDAKKLLERFLAGGNITESGIVSIGPTLSVHMGIGGVGICVWWED